jgi:hypothetical protein
MNESEFAFRIRQALNEGVDSVSYKAGMRLERARQLAVGAARGAKVTVRPATVHLPALQLATSGGAPIDAPGGGDLWSWLRGAGLLAPVLTLAIGFVAIHEWHNRRAITELADVDFAVLLDEAPISAYADRGFSQMLSQGGFAPPADELQPAHGAADPETTDEATGQATDLPTGTEAATAPAAGGEQSDPVAASTRQQ